MPTPPSASFQESFAVSDDVAELLASGVESEPIDATELGLGTLVELWTLRRATRGSLTIRDRSPRGNLLRRVLGSRQAFACVDGLGLYHAGPGKASTANEATDFADVARSALLAAGLLNEAAWRLSGALRELLSNVDEHAGDDATCLSGFSIERGEAWLCVADTGIGVLEGYQRSALQERPCDAMQALQWAVVQHRSRTAQLGRGTGFETVANALRSLDASMRVRSDEASLELEQRGSVVEVLLREQGPLTGFIVSMHLRWRDD